MRDFRDLAREYEERHFPPTRRLDLHGEGPVRARELALQWIQSRAHEQPGDELLLIVERGRAPGRPPTAVRRAVERLLGELQGKLVDWWQDFGTGGLALRISDQPSVLSLPARPEPVGEGRTPETAGAFLPVSEDIPEELQGVARRIAELRRDREQLSLGLMEVILRRVWIEAQATAMQERVSFEEALEEMLEEELGEEERRR